MVIIVLTLTSCNQAADLVISPLNESQLVLKSGQISSETTNEPNYFFNPKSYNFTAGQHYMIGDIKIVTDREGDFWVTVSTTDGWKLKNIQMYVGPFSDLPLNKNGLPMIGNFPVNTDFSAYQDSYSYKFINKGGTAFPVIVVHANAVQINESGKILKSEAAWIEGERFVEKGSWASYNTYPLMPGGS